MSRLTTIILAAGKGTRMKSEIPKVLHPVLGRPLIRYILDIAHKVNSTKTIVVLGHKFDVVKKALGEGYVCVKQQRLLGTGDAIRCARGSMGTITGDVLILCGDTPLLQPLSIKQLLKTHRKSGADATVLTASVFDPTGYGRIIRCAEQSIMAIREEQDASYDEKLIDEINTGVYCFKAKALFDGVRSLKVNKKKKEYFLTDIIALLIQRGGRVGAVMTDDPTEGWGVNTRCDLARIQSVIRQRVLQQHMLNGVTIVDPDTTHIQYGVKIGKDTTVNPFTVIDADVRVGKECVVGPFTHLRSGSRIDDNVEVGNFAEVSRATIGKHSFMKHFSFIGDATVGAYSNIGAGVVTANFDGKNKHATRIGAGAFIGSDSILIAPTVIGKGAVTGAGSVVTKGTNVPPGGVIVGVPGRVHTKKKRSSAKVKKK